VHVHNTGNNNCSGITIGASDQPMLNKGWASATWEQRQAMTAQVRYRCTLMTQMRGVQLRNVFTVTLALQHTYFELGTFYFLANDPSVPADVRALYSSYGLCSDEFQVRPEPAKRLSLSPVDTASSAWRVWRGFAGVRAHACTTLRAHLQPSRRGHGRHAEHDRRCVHACGSGPGPDKAVGDHHCCCPVSPSILQTRVQNPTVSVLATGLSMST
jgi:hypothetical protein